MKVIYFSVLMCGGSEVGGGQLVIVFRKQGEGRGGDCLESLNTVMQSSFQKDDCRNPPKDTVSTLPRRQKLFGS